MTAQPLPWDVFIAIVLQYAIAAAVVAGSVGLLLATIRAATAPRKRRAPSAGVEWVPPRLSAGDTQPVPIVPGQARR